MTALFPGKAGGLVNKHLTSGVFEYFKNRQTANGFTLEQAVKSGIDNPDSRIGLYAGDAESYRLFSDVFEPVISDYHSFCPDDRYKRDFSDCHLPPPDPEGRYVISTRIRLARNIAGYPFPACIGSQTRYTVEKLALTALHKLPEEFNGRYFSFETLDSEAHGFLSNRNLLFTGQDRFQASAGITRDFPKARGVFLSYDNTFAVLINEEDHLRIISYQPGPDLATAFNRLGTAYKSLEEQLEFSFSDKYGFLTSCPSNVGTAMRASVHMHIPGFSEMREKIYAAAARYGLQIRGTTGENTEIENSIIDISNRKRLGITEKECITVLHKGISCIINLLDADTAS